MKIALQGSFDIGYSIGYSDSWLTGIMATMSSGVSQVETQGDYEFIAEKASFGFNLKGGYGIEIDIYNNELNKIWNREARRLAFDLKTFAENFDCQEEEILEMRKIWPEIIDEKVHICLFSNGICELEKIINIPDNIGIAVPLHILHCFEYSGYGAYFESINDFPKKLEDFINETISDSIKNVKPKDLKKNIYEVKKITRRPIGKKTDFIKTFTLFIFSDNETIIDNIYNYRIKISDSIDDYIEMPNLMNKAYFSWYIQLIYIKQMEIYDEIVNSYLWCFRFFDQFISSIDIINNLSAHIYKELTAVSIKALNGRVFNETELRNCETI